MRVCALLVLLLTSCAQKQSPECQVYIECQRAYETAFDLSASDLQKFESEGSCWSHPKTAGECDALCTAQTRSLFQAADAAEVRLEKCVLP